MNGEQNGQAPARISINPDRPGQTIDLDTARTMLQRWRKRHPAQFGYWLADAVTDVEPSRSGSEPSARAAKE